MRATRLALATAVCGLSFPATTAADYQAPTFSSSSLVNAATGQTLLSPYSICTLYGTNLFLNGSAGATDSTTIPDTLAGVTILIGSVQGGILFVSANQINLLIPNSLTPGSYSIRVVRDGITSQAVPMVLQEVAPGLFASAPGFAVAHHADGTAVSQNSPAAAGEVIVFYGTGFGRTRPDPSGLSIEGTAAPIIHLADFEFLLDGVPIDPSLVQYVGIAPFNAGLYQMNIRMPDNLSMGNPEVRVNVAGVLSPAGLRLITGP